MSVSGGGCDSRDETDGTRSFVCGREKHGSRPAGKTTEQHNSNGRKLTIPQC